MFLERTVSPKTSPSTAVTRYPGTSFMVEMSMRLIVGGGCRVPWSLPIA
jgi:hypothetical protein